MVRLNDRKVPLEKRYPKEVTEECYIMYMQPHMGTLFNCPSIEGVSIFGKYIQELQ